MPITFDRVSYSYDAPPTKKRKKQVGVAQAGQETTSTQTDEQVLSDISFELADGDFLGIAGHTGSGKSTLIQHMNGLLHPTSGRVLVDGIDISDKTAASAARISCGMVFQYPEHQLFAPSVYDDVAFGPRNMQLTDEEVEQRVREALALVSLDTAEILERSPFELSGGQQRRVAFAGVLAMKPSRLILDEPLAGLDPAARKDFLNLIAELHATGLTVVMVSHMMDDLARLCNRILVLNKGRIFALGSPEEVFAKAAELRTIGLGVPEAQRLANELAAAGLPFEQALYDTEALAKAIVARYRQVQGKAASPTSTDGTADNGAAEPRGASHA